jgi:hypothetical protein
LVFSNKADYLYTYGLAMKIGGANGEAVGGTELRGMRRTDSQFCFGR